MGKIIGIIPARWGSTRFPGKPLHPIAGKPLIQHVWERCQAARRLDSVIVATDDARIAEAVVAFGGEVSLTSPEHQSGTDRAAEVAAGLGRKVSHIINIQGDEPAIAPELIDRLAETLRKHKKLDMVTAANPVGYTQDLENPNCVKVVLAQNGDALYFSRSLIPYPLGAALADAVYYRHQGIYGYARKFLAEFVTWKPSTYEKAERLEQLRALEHGAKIRVLITEHQSLGVDAPEDVARAEQTLLAEYPTA